MELEYDSRPRPPTQWQEATSPTSSYLAQRRRSSAANQRPAGPPPNLPIPSVPTTHLDSSQQTRPTRSTSFARPSPSPNLTAVAAFSQVRQASSSMQTHDDLSDPPPQSYLPPSSSRHQDRSSNEPSRNDHALLSPTSEQQNRPDTRPSSRRALTRALELAREAVQLDSTNDNPEAAVHAYAQSVALLSEVMERVRNGEDSGDGNRRRRRRSAAAQEDEVRRLQNIHDTYADRMNILSLIYRIPTIPYTSGTLYSNTGISNDSTTSNSPTTSASPSSDNSPSITAQTYIPSVQDDLYSDPNPHQSPDKHQSSILDAVYTLDESVLTGSTISDLPSTQHPYAIQYEPIAHPPPISQPPPIRNSILSRRNRAPSSLPPKPPPPADSLPQPPLAYEPTLEPTWRQETLQPRPTETTGHRRTGSGLGAVEEEAQDLSTPTHIEVQPPSGNEFISDSYRHVSEYPRALVRKESPPLPPLPSLPVPDTPQSRAISIPRSPPSPRITNIIAPRPRGSSQLTTRTELANVPQINSANMQRRKTSAPPSTRSASPAESTASAGSAPYSKPIMAPMPPSGNLPLGRLRSSSQPGRRPSIVGGRMSPDQLPPLPGAPGVNGMARKVSVPSKLNPHQGASLYIDPTTMQASSMFNPHLVPGLSNNLPTTPTSPLPPAPPSDPLLQPYHLMSLLRNTMTASTGGYVTRRLHVPCEVWSQGGAKLTNLDEKIRVVTILCSALEDLQVSSAESFGAGNLSNGLGLGIGGTGRKEADTWLAKLDEFSNVCDHVVANFGKKLGVGEGFVSRKTTWGDKWTRRLDKFTNGKNLDSPAAYVQGLKKLFLYAQLLDEHTRAIFSQPVAPTYSAFPSDIRASTEQRLKRFSEFFASVVLTFVIRDLSQLLDKYVKKLEKWLAE